MPVSHHADVPAFDVHALLKKRNGHYRELARLCGITEAAVRVWRRVPEKYLAEVSLFVGVRPEVIRPDIVAFERRLARVREFLATERAEAEQQRAPPEAVSHPAALRAAMMATVLVAEDDLLIADLLQQALEAEGYSVSGIARTVAEAKTLAEQHPPDFAVIDIRLADGGLGTEIGAHLRATTHAGIIYSTGNSTDLELSTLHGDAVMTKPYRSRDMACGLRIIAELEQPGQAYRTPQTFPRNFQLLDPPGL